MSKNWKRFLGVAGTLAVAYVGKKIYDKYKNDEFKKLEELKDEIKDNEDIKKIFSDLEKATDKLVNITEELIQKEVQEVSEMLEQGKEILAAKVGLDEVNDVLDPNVVKAVEAPGELPKVEEVSKQDVGEKSKQKIVNLSGQAVEEKIVSMIENAKKEIIISVPNLTWEAYEDYHIFDLLRKKIIDEKVYVKINCGVGEIYDWHNQMVESIQETIEVAHQLKKEFINYNNFNIDIKDSKRKVLICDKQNVLITTYSFLAHPMYIDEVEDGLDVNGEKILNVQQETASYIESSEYACDLIRTINNIPRRNKEVDAYLLLNNL